MTEILERFREKVSMPEFKSAISLLFDKNSVIFDKLELEVPAMEHDLRQNMAKLCTKEEFGELVLKMNKKDEEIAEINKKLEEL